MKNFNSNFQTTFLFLLITFLSFTSTAQQNTFISSTNKCKSDDANEILISKLGKGKTIAFKRKIQTTLDEGQYFYNLTSLQFETDSTGNPKIIIPNDGKYWIVPFDSDSLLVMHPGDELFPHCECMDGGGYRCRPIPGETADHHGTWKCKLDGCSDCCSLQMMHLPGRKIIGGSILVEAESIEIIHTDNYYSSYQAGGQSVNISLSKGCNEGSIIVHRTKGLDSLNDKEVNFFNLTDLIPISDHGKTVFKILRDDYWFVPFNMNESPKKLVNGSAGTMECFCGESGSKAGCESYDDGVKLSCKKTALNLCTADCCNGTYTEGSIVISTGGGILIEASELIVMLQ